MRARAIDSTAAAGYGRGVPRARERAEDFPIAEAIHRLRRTRKG